MVVRFGLKRNVELVVEPNQASIIDEGAVYPRSIDLVRRSSQELIQQTIDLLNDFAGFVRDINRGAEGFVGAMFAPRLSDGLDLGVGWVAPDSCEVCAHCLHLDQVQAQSTTIGYRLQIIIGYIDDSENLGSRSSWLNFDEASSE